MEVRASVGGPQTPPNPPLICTKEDMSGGGGEAAPFELGDFSDHKAANAQRHDIIPAAGRAEAGGGVSVPWRLPPP